MEKIKLVIVDSEEVFREGITRLLQEQAHMDVVYHGSSGKDAVANCNRNNPDVVMIDSHGAEYDALEVVKEIKSCRPDTKIVIISRPDNPNDQIEFMKSGARAFLAKNISARDLVKSIELVSSGRIVSSPHFAEKFIAEIAQKRDEGVIKESPSSAPISERELEITRLIAQGATNREIAEKLCITENTTKVHVKNILSKLELKNRQQLAVYAVMKEWVKSNPDAESKEDVQRA